MIQPEPAVSPDLERSAPAKPPALKWDDSRMHTSYANAVNVSSTREEVSIFFGTNQTWNVTEDKQVVIQLDNRVVLNPYAAKRLTRLLGSVLKEYETRFGALPLD